AKRLIIKLATTRTRTSNICNPGASYRVYIISYVLSRAVVSYFSQKTSITINAIIAVHNVTTKTVLFLVRILSVKLLNLAHI
ncbi:hypothetical protein KAW04_02730, partial [Candidatus Bathyarchaeota archaeon]|nr:hypothetical protein [Candidatus Bathyarchaeota archaeon]